MSMSKVIIVVASMLVGVAAFAGEDPPSEGGIPDSQVGLIEGVSSTPSVPLRYPRMKAPLERCPCLRGPMRNRPQ